MESKKDLGWLVCHASVLIRREIDRAVTQATGDPTLSGRNTWVLRYLADHREEDVFQRDLENVFKIRRSTVSCTVDLMEQKGLLARQAVNGDGRLKKLCLTSEGERVLKAADLAISRFEEGLLAAMTEERYRETAAIIESLCNILEPVESRLDAREERKDN